MGVQGVWGCVYLTLCPLNHGFSTSIVSYFKGFLSHKSLDYFERIIIERNCFSTKFDLYGINKTSFGLDSPQLDFQYQESIQRCIQLKMCYQIILRRLILNKSECLKTKSEQSGELVTTFQMMKPQIHFQYLLRFQRNSSRNFVWKFSRSDIFSHVTKGSKVNSVKLLLIWSYQVSLVGSQKFFLIWIAVTILEGWKAESETASSKCV